MLMESGKQVGAEAATGEESKTRREARVNAAASSPIVLRSYEPAADLEGTVYVLAISPWVKIGYTDRSITKRLAELAAGSAWPYEALYTVEADQSLEHELHELFAHLRSHGEWFRARTEVVALFKHLDALPSDASRAGAFRALVAEALVSSRSSPRRRPIGRRRRLGDLPPVVVH